jgi:hypothetical protein
MAIGSNQQADPGRPFQVAGRSMWLVSGSVHYFRIPSALWRDRLQKAKWAGLNAIETPVPWNWHELKPGKYEFRKDADLEAFLETAAEVGLYAIVRVGPFIGADWEGGGLPADLLADPSHPIRDADPRFLARVEEWFAELLPRLAKRQAVRKTGEKDPARSRSRGGSSESIDAAAVLAAGAGAAGARIDKSANVIAVGIEHEYFFPERPRGDAYLNWLVKQVRGAKIDLPILGTTHFHNHVKGVLETWADGEDALGGLRTLAERQPGKPRIVLHLNPGSPDRWGGDRRFLKTPRQVAGQAMRILAEGGMYNWSPFAGGTNPGLWAGRLARDDFGFLTTAADGDAPIGESGAMGRKYRAIKTVDQFAAEGTGFAGFLSSCEPVKLKIDLPTGFTTLVRRGASATNQGGSGGTVIFVFRDDGVEDLWADITLPNPTGAPPVPAMPGPAGATPSARARAAKEVALPLDFTHDDALPLLYDYRLGNKLRIDYCNCPVLGTWQDRMIFFHGPAGAAAVVACNGVLHEFKIPEGVGVEWREVAEGHFLAFMNTPTAHATWFLPDRVVISALSPGEKNTRAIEAVPDEGVVVVGRDGNPVHAECRKAPEPRPPRRVGNWKRAADVPECRGEGDGWKRLPGNGPSAASEAVALGVPRGYLWYRIRTKFERKRSLTLLPAGAEDRVRFWVNGKPLGVWGRGPGATRDPLPAEIDLGDVTVTALVEVMGRFSRRLPPPERKGIFEGIYHANPLHLSAPAVSTPAAGSLPKEIKPVWTLEAMLTPEPGRMCVADMHFSQPQGSHIALEIRGLPEPCWVFVNDAFAGFFHGRAQAGFHSAVLPAPKGTLNHLRVYFPSRHQRSLAERFRVCDLAENVFERAEWSWKPWTAPDPEKDRWSRELKDDGPVRWYSAQFPEVKSDEPTFLNLAGLRKGVAILNGRPLGRYWTLGPQSRLYLPEPYLGKTNDLMIFEEEGGTPGDVQLEFDPAGPYGDPHAPPPAVGRKNGRHGHGHGGGH